MKLSSCICAPWRTKRNRKISRRIPSGASGRVATPRGSICVVSCIASLAWIEWRDTRDLDLYTFERDREQLIQLLTSLGFVDYFEQKPYDRQWIYRSWKDGTIIDVIWAMANRRATVDDRWLQGPTVEVDGHRIHLLAPEEMIWNKLY